MSQRCALCLKSRKLCESHIIPEFAYRPLYDDKHRFLTFTPLTPDETQYQQKGLRSPVLCEDCEGFLNDRFEKPFQRYWLEGNALSALDGKNIATLTGIDYGPFKLFHLSVLFRASACEHPDFEQVALGPQHEVIRQMILDENPGPAWKYPIVCSAIEGEGGEVSDYFIGAAAIRVRGHTGYLITFCSCQWIYVVSTVGDPEIEKIALTEQGELPVSRQEWAVLRHAREQLRRRKG